MRPGVERLSPRPHGIIPLPDYTASGVCDVDFELLGKSHVLLDLDLTGRRTGATSLEPTVVEHLQVQKDSGVVQTVSLATNNGTDLTRFAEPLEAEVFQPFMDGGEWVQKPDARFFGHILSKLDIDPSTAVMIGDQYRRDILGASRAGITTVLVEPLGADTLADRLLLMRTRDKYALRQARLANVSDRIIEQFEIGLESCTPYLFNLAEQLCVVADERKWNLIIGDDTSGRLVTRFMRLALADQGHSIPTRYFDVSRDSRTAQNTDALQKHVAGALDESSDPRILVITENSVTFETLRYIRDSIAPYCERPDFAILAAAQIPDDFSEAFFGAIGEEASRAVYDTFERVPAISRKLQFVDWLRQSNTIRKVVRAATPATIRRRGNQSTAALTNLQKTPRSQKPFASICENNRYRDVAAHCYRRMGTLAISFAQEQANGDADQTLDQADTTTATADVSELLHPELFQGVPIIGSYVAIKLAEHSKQLALQSIQEQDLSVVIRTLNEREALKYLLDDIHHQEFSRAVEIVVVDNESTDGTPEAAEEAGVKVVTLARDQFTYPRSMNLGVAATGHELVLLTVGHARLVSRQAFRSGVRHFTDNSVKGVYGMAIPNANASSLERMRSLTVARGLAPQRVSTIRPGVLNAISAMISRSTWAEHGGFDERYEMGSEDRALAQAMIKSDYEVVREPGLAVHHSHGHGSFNTLRQWGRTVRGRLPGYQQINRETLQKKRPHLKF